MVSRLDWCFREDDVGFPIKNFNIKVPNEVLLNFEAGKFVRRRFEAVFSVFR